MTNRELQAWADELAHGIGPIIESAVELRVQLAAAAQREQPGTLGVNVGLTGLVADLTSAQRALSRAASRLTTEATA